MAYNNSKGPRGFGDIKNEDDVDTQIDFGSDSIGFKTNNITRFTINNTALSASHSLPLYLTKIVGNGGTENYRLSISSSATEHEQGIQFTGSVGFSGSNDAGQLQKVYYYLPITSSTSISASSVVSYTNTLHDIGAGVITGIIGAGHLSISSSLTEQNEGISFTGSVGFTGSNDAGSLEKVTYKLPIATNTYLEFTEMTAPGNPASNVGRLYSADDSGTTKLYFKDSAGTATDLMAGGLSQANQGNNRVITSVDATNINAEANLTFDGDTLKAVGQITSSLGLGALSGSFQEGVAVGGSTIISADKDITNVRSLTASANIYAVNGYYSGILDVEGNVVLGNAASDITIVTGRLTASQGLSVNVDDYPIVLGGGEDLNIKHDGSISIIQNKTGHLVLDNTATSKDIRLVLGSDSADTEAVKIRNNSGANKWVCDAAGNVSGSGTLQSVGAAILGNTLAVSGTVSVAEKIEHAGDTDTYISFTDDDINFQAGGVNFLDITEDGSQDEVTFNEGGVDIDFRVETADESHMLFIEGSSNRMSIGDNTGSPGATLEIKNHASAGAAGVPLVQLNSNDTDEIALDINASNIDANVVDVTANAVTTAKVINVSADGLTTGNALYVDDNSSNTGTRNTAIVIQNNAAAIAATALHVQSDGGVTGINLDKNYSDTAEASIVGLNIDWDKTGASTSDNTMYGIQVDMDNTTATNGNNYMYGLHITPTLSHAADAGGAFLYGALINAQGGTNGSSFVQGARIEAGGGDINYGLQLDVEDGGVDLRIESSADNGDYFQIQTTTHGATTITTVDDNATAANLTFTIDGDITLDPAGGDVIVDGNVSGSGTLQAVGNAFVGGTLHVSGACSSSAGLAGLALTVGGAGNRGFDEDAQLSVNAINANSQGISNAGAIAGATTISGSGAVSGFTGTFEGGLNVGGSIVITEDKVLQNVTTNFSALSASGGVAGLTLTIGGAGNRGFDEDAQLSANAINVNSGGITNAGAIAGASTISGSGAVSGLTVTAEGGFKVLSTTVITEDKELRTRQPSVTRHAYNVGSSGQRWIPFYNVSDLSFGSADETSQMVAPADGRIKRIIFRPTNEQSGGATRISLYKAVNATFATATHVEHVDVTCSGNASTSNVFNFSGSSHFSAGDVVGITIDPENNPGDVNVVCIWEYDMTGL